MTFPLPPRHSSRVRAHILLEGHRGMSYELEGSSVNTHQEFSIYNPLCIKHTERVKTLLPRALIRSR